jgi:hypothetical protein
MIAEATDKITHLKQDCPFKLRFMAITPNKTPIPGKATMRKPSRLPAPMPTAHMPTMAPKRESNDASIHAQIPAMLMGRGAGADDSGIVLFYAGRGLDA